MLSRKPYLLRAIHEWICDNGMTPHVLVDCEQPGVEVPAEVIRDGRVVLNISPMAAHRLSMTNQGIDFSARFNGHERHIRFPPRAVLAIYARENGQGLMFSEADDGDEPPPDNPPVDPSSGSGGRPKLSVVK
ncbi:ClpXP protease specificity-enhancing factor [Candidatus Macondimonas diazotrophica]|jgi:stringent starvation protein B|uniref:ClpXP protease specificity-enhancing factor n=1 Tax=Candidatus Macondimonas diazotrophica TaxID=2305248 RepID=A0A4Z0FB49_9GAMM|nr:ClpXP protease specificity-enhancing factor [Candidatus Macondimonas diazotrophica]NCU00230.1 ClpXP protease specificity-enhancing factor [Candidatus Macondimonas diazotrophica]TFZ83023.1 ClpXP protease specificity-enhancing factor [Candidatus Macondimonas diazotrophica]HBG29384.1 ClpXP protease specificity-enhancing factor [Gammaproteobacteria bacterium]HBG51266.1 ClpXP protease specificity-enhancing factor [Gammaproteobacteria bacterium]